MTRSLDLLDAPVRQAAEVERVAAGRCRGASARVDRLHTDRALHLCLWLLGCDSKGYLSLLA